MQVRQVDVIPMNHVPASVPAGPRDHWIYATVAAVDAGGVTVTIAHAGNRWNGTSRRYTTAEASSEIRTLADVLALEATAKAPELRTHYARQAKALTPPSSPIKPAA